MIGRPGSLRATSSLWFAAVAVALVVGLLPDLRRPGYSPDEEYTQFAVRGIRAQGLPLLPSGLLYDRGLLYSYAAASAGESLVTARLVSLMASIAALGVIFAELRRIAAAAAAVLGVALTAASLPFWVSATTARFYAPFLLGYVLVLAALSRLSLSWRGLAVLAAAAAATRWTHELAFTLVAVPVVAALLTHAGERRGWIARAVAVAAGLAAGQAAILAVHALAPPSNGDVMVRRFFVWQVVNLLERPPFDLAATLPAAAGFGVAAALGAGGDSGPGRRRCGGADCRRRGGRGPRSARGGADARPGRAAAGARCSPTTRAHRAGGAGGRRRILGRGVGRGGTGPSRGRAPCRSDRGRLPDRHVRLPRGRDAAAHGGDAGRVAGARRRPRRDVAGAATGAARAVDRLGALVRRHRVGNHRSLPVVAGDVHAVRGWRSTSRRSSRRPRESCARWWPCSRPWRP